MDEKQLVWDHFKFNAEQRLKGFNFFVLLSIFADGGVFTALEKGLNPRLLILLGLFIALLAVVFWLVDSRSRQLINLTIPAMKEMEASFPDKLSSSLLMPHNKVLSSGTPLQFAPCFVHSSFLARASRFMGIVRGRR